ncbi:UNVERIFIED_CONTAM: hypothetical protein HDU68_002571 [Siphonaria sp. JEL0065]|nr:hypothetical protein HDU68_002571 [Siphonaria sp. JEL0065]
MASLFRSKSLKDLSRGASSDTRDGGSGGGNFLARAATLGRSQKGNAQQEEIVYPLSDSGVPITAPAAIVPLPPINYSLRGATLERGKTGEVKEIAPNPVKLNTSKAAQTTALKWWQAPGMTKETQAALAAEAAAAAENSQEPNNTDSLPRKGFSSTANGSGGRAKFHQFEEVAIIKSNFTNSQKGPQFGDMPRLVDKCGAGTTIMVIHNFTAVSSTDVSVSIDDVVRILRVDPGGWVQVKILKLGAPGPGSSQKGAVHRGTVGSQVGTEGTVPLGVLDLMKTKRVQQQGGPIPGVAGNAMGSFNGNGQQQSMNGGIAGIPSGPGGVRGPRPMRSMSTG